MDETSTPGPEWHWDGTTWLWWNGDEWQAVPEAGAAGDVAATPPPPSAPGVGGGPPPVAPGEAPARRGIGAGAITAIVLGVVLVLVLVGGGVAFFLLNRSDAESTAVADSDVVTLQTEPLSTATAAFTPSMGTDTPVTPAAVTAVQNVPAETVGLYGGTQDQASCDKTKLVAFLQANPDKAKVWAQTLAITPEQIPTYVASLTPLLLRSDTAVTNHGFENGKVTTFGSVLQAGTAVMVNDRGEPVVKCYCGNPLTPAPAKLQKVKYTGPTWPTFKPGAMTVVQSSPTVINNFVVVNVVNGQPFVRPASTDGAKDTPGSTPPSTPPPSTPAPAPVTPSTAPAQPVAPVQESGREDAAIAMAESRTNACLAAQGKSWSDFEGANWSATPTGNPGEYSVTVLGAASGETVTFTVNVDANKVSVGADATGCPGVYDG